VTERRFRLDLYYRLNVIPIRIPPLRERKEDVLPLTIHFLKYYCRKNNKTKSFSAQTLGNITDYSWPGNVRELKNFVERSVVMSFDDTIEIRNIAAIAAKSPASAGGNETLFPQRSAAPEYEALMEKGVTLEEYLAGCERRYVEYALNKHKSSYAAARALGTSQTSVMRRKKKFGL